MKASRLYPTAEEDFKRRMDELNDTFAQVFGAALQLAREHEPTRVDDLQHQGRRFVELRTDIQNLYRPRPRA